MVYAVLDGFLVRIPGQLEFKRIVWLLIPVQLPSRERRPALDSFSTLLGDLTHVLVSHKVVLDSPDEVGLFSRCLQSSQLKL